MTIFLKMFRKSREVRPENVLKRVKTIYVWSFLLKMAKKTSLWAKNDVMCLKRHMI